MKRIDHCINIKLKSICQRSMQLEELNSLLQHYLPNDLKEHCYAGSFNRGNLILMATDPAWATQLRYCIPELRDKLRAEAQLYQLSSIAVSVQCNMEKPISSNKKPHAISDKARKEIKMLAEHCRHLELKQALYHLAQVESIDQREKND